LRGTRAPELRLRTCKRIFAVVDARMTEGGFLLIDQNFKYVKKLNEVVDFVVQFKQNRRWPVVGEIELAPQQNLCCVSIKCSS